MCVHVFFFFQAEDGIRDLVRSRGLGDVYKRQLLGDLLGHRHEHGVALFESEVALAHHLAEEDLDAVSYTHLTLPTSDLV